MNLFKKIKLVFVSSNTPPDKVRLTNKNIQYWPSYREMLKKGRIRFDKKGRLRYNHGAPVGDLLLTRTNMDGISKYKESPKEWFDPESDKAKAFKWPN